MVTLLPDRERSTAEAWFAGHPGISIIARDRGGGYGEAAPHSEMALKKTRQRCTPQLSCHGRMDKPRVRSPARAREAPNVRSGKDRPAPGQIDRSRLTARMHQNCVKPNLEAD